MSAPRWLRLLPARTRRDPIVRALAALDPDPRRTALAVLTGTLALGCAVGLMAVSAWLISRAAQRPPVLYLQVAVVATRALGIGRGVLRYVERLGSHDVALRGVSLLRERLYTCLAAADPAVVAGLRRGDLLARVGADVDTLADLVVRSLLPFAVSLTTITLTAVLVAVILPGAGLVVAAGLLVAGIGAPWLTARAAARSERAAVRERAELSAEVLALLDGLAELTVAGAVPARLDRLRGAEARLTRALDASARPAGLAAAIGTAATGLAMVGALVLAVHATATGTLAPVLLAVVALTPLAAAEAVAALPAAAANLVRSRAAAQRVLDLLDAAPAVRPVAPPAVPANPPPRRPAGPAPGLRRPHLRATGLACGWPGVAPAVTGVDLDLPPGRRVAVVGASGGGKTTLLLTLAGLLPPVAGTLELAGDGAPWVPLAQVDDVVARRTVSFTAEDAHVFTTTVRENLRVADPGAADADLHAALDRAGLARWVAGLPAGLDTMLGSGGTGVSGGERRRLLLARAFIVGAGILLLDEPGEHLDPVTADTLVQQVLTDRISADVSVVLVTHRPSALEAADEVLVIEEGVIAARGTHAWLMGHHQSYLEACLAGEGELDTSPRRTIS